MTRSCASLERRYCVLRGSQSATSNFAPSSCLMAEQFDYFCAPTARLSKVLSLWHLCVYCQAQTKNGEQCVHSIRLRSALFHYSGSGEGVLPGRTIPKEESASRGAFSRRYAYRIAFTVYLHLHTHSPLLPLSRPVYMGPIKVRLGSTRFRRVDFTAELYEADQETANAANLAVAYMHAAVP